MSYMLLSPLARSTRPSTCFGLLGLLLLAAGCTGLADLERTSNFQNPYSHGDYAGAAAMLGGEDGLDYDEENLLTSLQVGSALRAAKSYDTSQTAFDRAEAKLLWKADEISDVGAFLKEGLTIVGNDLISSYHGNIYDGVLINTYKAMNALDMGDEARARVELNRADQRQSNAVHQLAAKVRALAEEDPEEAADSEEQSQQVDQTLTEATKPDSELGNRLAAVQALGEYRDLRNPFTDWLHGAFRLATGEANRASDLFRNAVVLDGERNSHVKEDFRVAEEAAGSTAAVHRRVWIVHEDGIGPHLDEFRVDLPVSMATGLLYAGIAVPEFITGAAGVGSLIVEADGANYRTEPLLNIDRYAATEFRAGYDAIIGKAVASAVVKVIAQIAAQEAADELDNPLLGMLLKIGTTAVAAATTQADTRMWQALPQSINVASLPWPADDRIRITAGNGSVIMDAQLPSAAFVIVTVKTVSASAPVAVHVAALSSAGTMSSDSGSTVVRPLAAIDEASDAPTIRLAVMQSEAAPELVRAGYTETANGHNITLAVSDTPVVAPAAKRATASPHWWKPHVSVDGTLKNNGLRELTFSHSLNTGGFMRVAGEFFNNSNRKLSAMYRFTWLDSGGQPVDSILGGWQVVHALPGTYARIAGTAPRDDANDFHLELAAVSRVFGTGETTHDPHNTR